MGRDAVTDATVLANVDAPIVVAPAEGRAALELQGRALAVRYPPAPAADAPAAARPALRNWARGVLKAATAQGAAAVVVIVPEAFDDQWERIAVAFPRGAYALDPDGTAPPRVAPRGTPLIYVRDAALGATPGSAAAAADAALGRRSRGSSRPSSPRASRTRPSTSSRRSPAAIRSWPASSFSSAPTRTTTASATP
jgi:hypothetical protein